MILRRSILQGTGLLLTSAAAWTQTGFDHRHSAWTNLLKRHVALVRGGQASRLSYAGMATDRLELGHYLAVLSTVTRAIFDQWNLSQQQAFLINAYNAFTVELILTRYPDLKSIKDLGGVFSSPWKRQWFQLLGATRSLDDLEHGLLRKPGVYDEPRVHFAVNCASVGCPMLREEAFDAVSLEAQLEQQTQRFMADRTRNRWNPKTARLEISKIFDWYGDDFRQGFKGISNLEQFLAAHANRLADAPADRQFLRTGRIAIDFLDYDWRLNDWAHAT